MWQRIVGSILLPMKNPNLFDYLIAESNEEDERQIKLDVVRTFPNHPYFKKPDCLG